MFSPVAEGQEQNTVVGTCPQNLRVGAGEATPPSQGRSCAVLWGKPKRQMSTLRLSPRWGEAGWDRAR